MSHRAVSTADSAWMTAPPRPKTWSFSWTWRMSGPICAGSCPAHSGAMRSSTARRVTGVASKPNASPQPSYPWTVVTFTSSESTGGLASRAPARNGMRSGNVSILAMASASTH